MKKMTIILLLAIASCNGQDKNADKGRAPESTEQAKPKVEVKVNRKYDSKGNLVRFDSTYSYFYSSKGKDSVRVGLDTIFQRFKAAHQNDFTAWRNDVNNIFFNDSLFKYDFLNEDFFSQRFEMNMQRMREMLRDMDSVKTDYLRHPGKELKKEDKRGKE
jgi:hypothetical protein